MGFKEFKEKIESDSAFAAKFTNIDSVDKVIELAKAEGYNISANDFKELSDDDLGAVSGGYVGNETISAPDGGGNVNDTLYGGGGSGGGAKTNLWSILLRLLNIMHR